jgi:hypothetical protein
VYPAGVSDGADATEEDALLAALGLKVIGDGDDAAVRAECIRVARRLHASRNRVIGFIPAAADIAVPPIAIQIGVALTELTGATIAVVDANVRYPAMSALAGGALADRDDSVFRTRWLRGSLALLTPPKAERAGEVVPQLARVLLEGIELFEHVLVDLTGLELLGEHGSASACMDTVIVVGRAHRTSEQQLLDLRQTIPANRFMGVLLVG